MATDKEILNMARKIAEENGRNPYALESFDLLEAKLRLEGREADDSGSGKQALPATRSQGSPSSSDRATRSLRPGAGIANNPPGMKTKTPSAKLRRAWMPQTWSFAKKIANRNKYFTRQTIVNL